MRPYSEFQPTGFDRKGAFLYGEDEENGNRQTWLVAPCGTNRDAEALTRSNWRGQLAELRRIDPKRDDHEVHRFGHWGPGWFELVLIRPASKCADLCEELERALANYPVLDDEDFSREEDEEAQELWRHSSVADRLHYIGRCGADPKVSMFAARRDELPAGLYVSDLLSC